MPKLLTQKMTKTDTLANFTEVVFGSAEAFVHGQKGEKMSEMMEFPETWEEFEKSYGFNDREEVYTNGSRLIPSFRVKQWLDHIAQKETKQQAIKASDCINRQDAIDAFEEFRGWLPKDKAHGYVCKLKKLPSAQPERKGTWINEGKFANYHGGNIYRCSKCGCRIIEREPDDFCKYCGSDNRGGGTE